MFAIVLDEFYSEHEWLVMAYEDEGVAKSDLNLIKSEIDRLASLGCTPCKVYSETVQVNGVGECVPSTLGQWFDGWTICAGDSFTIKPLEECRGNSTVYAR